MGRECGRLTYVLVLYDVGHPLTSATVLNPSLENLPRLDPADELLMYDGAAGSSSSSTVTGGGGGGGGHVAPQVSWLRKTEYTSRSENQRASTHDSYVIIVHMLSPVHCFAGDNQRKKLTFHVLRNYATLQLRSRHVMKTLI